MRSQRSRRFPQQSRACRRTRRVPAQACRACRSGTYRSRRAPRSPAAAPSSSVVAFAHAPLEEAAGGFGVVVGIEADAAVARACAGSDGLDSEPLCTRQKSSPAVNGCARSGVTADSVAMRVWPTRCVPVSFAKHSVRRLGGRARCLCRDRCAARGQHVQLRKGCLTHGFTAFERLAAGRGSHDYL